MYLIETLLRRHIGLDAASIGSSLIERTVRLRMQSHGLKTVDAYHELLTTCPFELDQLIEAIVVTETWFFRDREPFKAFAHLTLQDWRPRNPTGILRVLSLPCSTGEEPYSLAMALLDAGLPPAAFEIDAADISTTALTHAKQAVYGRNSFRGRELSFRDRYFQATKDQFSLSAGVRRCVKFTRGNILDEAFLAGSEPYHFIFCRNLLIYFDRTTQVLALRKLHLLLADDGVLFLGPAELPQVTECGFVNTGLPMAFACRKAGDKLPPPKPLRKRARATTATGVASQPPITDTVPAPVDGNLELERARQFANAGRLAEAKVICDAQIARLGPSAQAYFLLGLIKDATNDPTAINYYRKALYLEPNHHQALLQIMLALEKSGNVDAARIYKRRAERAAPKS